MASPIILNQDYIESQFRLWKSDPASVTPDWRHFFQGFELAAGRPDGFGSAASETAADQARVHTLVHRFREIGHLLACLDPLEACPLEHPLLTLESVGLAPERLDAPFGLPDGPDNVKAPLRDILAALRETYSRSVGVEFMHLQDPEERRWLIERMEPVRNAPALEPGEKRRILKKLAHAVAL